MQSNLTEFENESCYPCKFKENCNLRKPTQSCPIGRWYKLAQTQMALRFNAQLHLQPQMEFRGRLFLLD